MVGGGTLCGPGYSQSSPGSRTAHTSTLSHGEICSVNTTQARRRVESEEKSPANYCYRSNVVK